MAKPKKISPDAAKKMLDTPKFWLPNATITWVQTSVKAFPHTFKFRTGLEIERGSSRIEPEGLFIDCSFKKSIIDGVPDRISITLLVENARVFGIDENGPSRHLNRVGVGHPYYQKEVSHPHIHLPVNESCYGYVEPLPPQSIEDLWDLFLKKAAIHGAPVFSKPEAIAPDGQMVLI